MKSPLKIYPLGLDERGHQTLRVFFERQLGGSCLLASEEEAHATLIDGDNYHAKQFLLAHQNSHPERAIILLTLSPEQASIAHGIVVQKPIKASVFAEQLTELAGRLSQPKVPLRFSSASNEVLAAKLKRDGQASSPDGNASLDRVDSAAIQLTSREKRHYVGSMPDVDLSLAAERAKIYYDPDDFLQGHVVRAVAMGREHGTVVRVIGKSFPDIVIYPFANRVTCSAIGNVLFAAAKIPVHVNDIRVDLMRGVPHVPVEGAVSESIDAFLWRLTLWASRGRLPVGTALDCTVALRRWPNLTRLPDPPSSPRILGLWARRPCRLSETPAMLGLPQRYVFALYSACAMLDLIEIQKPSDSVPTATALPGNQEKRGLFSMLLKKLSLFRSDSDPSS